MSRIFRWLCPVLFALMLTLPTFAQRDNTPNWRKITRLDAGAVHDAAWHPDGQAFAIASATGLRVYDLELNMLVYGDWGNLHQLAWHPDGDMLAMSYTDSDEIALLNIHDLRQPNFITLIPNARAPLAWSPDGKWLAYADIHAQIHIREVDQQRSAVIFKEHRQVAGQRAPQVLDLAWSPNSTLLASTGEDTPLYVWSATTGDVLQQVSGVMGNLWQGAWLHWADDATLKVFDFHNFNRPTLHTITPATQTNTPVNLPIEDLAAAFNPHGDYFATLNFYQTVLLYDWQDEQPISLASEHFSSDATVISQESGALLRWSSDNVHLLTATEATVVLWRVQDEQLEKAGMLTDYNGGVNDLVWSPDGRYLASAHGDILGANSDARLRVWDVAERRLLWRTEWGMSSVLSLAWRSDGRYLATGHHWDACALRVWDVVTRTTVSCGTNAGVGDQLAWQPNGTVLAAMDQGRLQLWDTTPLTPTHAAEFLRSNTDEPFYPVGALAWLPAGEALVSSGYPGSDNVVIWRVADNEMLVEFEDSNVYTHNARGEPNPFALIIAVSPDARWIALAEGRIGVGVLDGLRLNATIAIYDAATGRRVRQLSGHRGGITALDWSADSTLLISGSRDGTARVWSPDETREVAKLLLRDEMIVAAVWSPTGERIAIGMASGALYLLGD